MTHRLLLWMGDRGWGALGGVGGGGLEFEDNDTFCSHLGILIGTGYLTTPLTIFENQLLFR
jgi:hypothetical protein